MTTATAQTFANFALSNSHWQNLVELTAKLIIVADLFLTDLLFIGDQGKQTHKKAEQN
jgi:hypothetical protein